MPSLDYTEALAALMARLGSAVHLLICGDADGDPVRPGGAVVVIDGILSARWDQEVVDEVADGDDIAYFRIEGVKSFALILSREDFVCAHVDAERLTIRTGGVEVVVSPSILDERIP